MQKKSKKYFERNKSEKEEVFCSETEKIFVINSKNENRNKKIIPFSEKFFKKLLTRSRKESIMKP